MIFARTTWSSEVSDCGRYTVSWARLPNGWCYQAFHGTTVISTAHANEPCYSAQGRLVRANLHRQCIRHAAGEVTAA